MVYHIIISLAYCGIFIPLLYDSRLIVIPAYHYRRLTLSDWRHVLGQHFHINEMIVIVTAVSFQHKSSPTCDNHMSVISILYHQDNIMTMYVIVMLSGYVTSSFLGIFPYSTIPCCICKVTPSKSVSKHAMYQTKIDHGSRRAGSILQCSMSSKLVYQYQISLYISYFVLIPCAAPQPRPSGYCDTDAG